MIINEKQILELFHFTTKFRNELRTCSLENRITEAGQKELDDMNTLIDIIIKENSEELERINDKSNYNNMQFV